MATESFEKNSLGWQLQQLQNRVGEWWEFRFRQLSDNLPQVSEPTWLSTLIEEIAKICLIFLLLVALWQLWRRLRPYLYSLRKQLSQPVTKTQPASVSDLSVTSWLRRSHKFQQQGNYDQACRCLYLAMLQQLHDRGVVLHQQSRTDGEYGELIQKLPQPQPYQTLLQIHQQLCFSKIEASLALWDECHQAYRELSSL